MLNLKKIIAFILLFVCIFSVSCSNNKKENITETILYSDDNCDVIFYGIEEASGEESLNFKLVNKTDKVLEFSFSNITFNSCVSSLDIGKELPEHSEEKFILPVWLDESFNSIIGNSIDCLNFTLDVNLLIGSEDSYSMDTIVEGKKFTLYPTGLDENTYVAPGRPTYSDGKLLIDTPEYCLYYISSEYDEFFDGINFTYYFENSSNQEIEAKITNCTADGVEYEPYFGSTVEKGTRQIVSMLIESCKNAKSIEFTFEIFVYNEDCDEIVIFTQDCAIELG